MIGRAGIAKERIFMRFAIGEILFVGISAVFAPMHNAQDSVGGHLATLAGQPRLSLYQFIA